MFTAKNSRLMSREIAPGLKKAKDRLTVLGCTNATGTHKLKPILIGKSAKPRCFKNVNMDALPVTYKSQRNAWMNSEIFAEWFTKEFVPAVKRHQRLQNIHSPKALLLIDNCSAHPDELSSCDRWFCNMHVSSSEHYLSHSADGSRSLASDEESIQEKASPESYLRSRPRSHTEH